MATPLTICGSRGEALYPTPSQRPTESRPQPKLKPHTHENVTPRARWELTNHARTIYGSVPMVAAAIEARARFAFANGCFIKSHSVSAEFALAQESAINEVFYRDPNILGDNHDMHSMLIELSINLERDGGQAAVFDSETGKVMVIPTTLIGNGIGLKAAGSGEVTPLSNKPSELGYWGLGPGGFTSYSGATYGYEVISDKNSPYFGARIIDGFIVDRNRAYLAVRVLGFNDKGEPSYKDIPAAQIRVNFKTTWSDQIGFIPQLATAIMSIVNVQDFDYYIKQAMILAAQKAVTRTTKDGKAPATGGVGFTYVDADGTPGTTNPGTNAPAGATRIQAYEMNAAGMVELSTDNNEEIKVVSFDRPSLNEEQFIERIERGYLHRIWPYDLIYGKKSARAFSRSLMQQTRMNIWEEQRQGEKFLRWAINQRTAFDMRRGSIPKNNNLLDPYNYEVIWPAEITSDEGYDAQIALDKLGRNLTTHRQLAGSDGYTHQKIQKENIAYADGLIRDAVALANKHKDSGLTAKDVLMMIDNMGNNNPQISQQTSGNADKKTKPTANQPAAE